MKFSKFREFRPMRPSLESIIKYISVDLVFSLRELYTGLSRLNFTENFQAFKKTVTVPATSELKIVNELTPVVPSGKIILRDGGSSAVVDGDSAWSTDYVYLKNTSGADVTVTVVFFR